MYVAVQPIDKALLPSRLIPWECRETLRRLTVVLHSARTVSVVAHNESGKPMRCEFRIVGHRSDLNARSLASYAWPFLPGGFQPGDYKIESEPSVVFDRAIDTSKSTLRIPWPEYPITVLWIMGKSVKTQAVRMLTAQIPDVWDVAVSDQAVSVGLQVLPKEVAKATDGVYLVPLDGSRRFLTTLPFPGNPSAFDSVGVAEVAGAWPGEWRVLLVVDHDETVHESRITIGTEQSGTAEFVLNLPELTPGRVEVHDRSGRYSDVRLYRGSVFYRGAKVRGGVAGVENVFPGEYRVLDWRRVRARQRLEWSKSCPGS